MSTYDHVLWHQSVFDLSVPDHPSVSARDTHNTAELLLGKLLEMMINIKKMYPLLYNAVFDTTESTWTSVDLWV